MDAVLSGDTIWDICSDQPFIRNCHKDTEKRTRWVRGTENFYLIIRNHGENTENQLDTFHTYFLIRFHYKFSGYYATACRLNLSKVALTCSQKLSVIY